MGEIYQWLSWHHFRFHLRRLVRAASVTFRSDPEDRELHATNLLWTIKSVLCTRSVFHVARPLAEGLKSKHCRFLLMIIICLDAEMEYRFHPWHRRFPSRSFFARTLFMEFISFERRLACN